MGYLDVYLQGRVSFWENHADKGGLEVIRFEDIQLLDRYLKGCVAERWKTNILFNTS